MACHAALLTCLVTIMIGCVRSSRGCQCNPDRSVQEIRANKLASIWKGRLPARGSSHERYLVEVAEHHNLTICLLRFRFQPCRNTQQHPFKSALNFTADPTPSLQQHTRRSLTPLSRQSLKRSRLTSSGTRTLGWQSNAWKPFIAETFRTLRARI